MPKISALLPVLALTAFALSPVAPSQHAQAQDVTLRGATALPEGDFLVNSYHIFADKLAEVSDGAIVMRYVGGPETIDPFEIGAAVRRGVTDIAVTPAAYYADEVPQGLALSYSELSTQEEIDAGSIEYLDQRHMEQMGAKLLGRVSEVEFALFTREPVNNLADFEGLRMRGTPTYRPLIEALGAQMVAMPGGEVYTALERGVVDGFGWAHIGMAQMGLQELAKARVMPTFYRMDIVMIMNADTWSSLTEAQQDMIEEAVRLTQAELPRAQQEFAEQEEQRYAEAGVVDSDLGPEFRALAYDSAWEWMATQLPDDVDELVEYFRKN